MKFSDFKKDKGVAGLTILLSLVTMLFVIGLLVMIFSMMGGEIRDASYTAKSVSAVNETTTSSESVGVDITLDADAFRDGACGDITIVYNGTEGSNIAVGNFTQTGCDVVNASTMVGWATTLFFNYPYTFNDDNSATDVMNDTTVSIASVTDWFTIFIVIGAMVVLILLTVIIITAIRGSGLMTGSTPTGRQNVGSA